jgi:hypothetical protein
MPGYTFEDLLRDVADAIVQDDRSFGLDRLVREPGMLDRFSRHFRNYKDEVVANLAAFVQSRTEGRRTIRRADINLFADRVKGANLYLVYCDVSIPVGETVTDLTNDMVMVSFGPFRNGLEIGAKRASVAEIQRLREQAVKAARELALRTAGEENAKQFLSKLTVALRTILIDQGKNAAVEELDRELTYRVYGVKEVAVMCVVNDISFDDVVMRAITS